MVFFSLFRNFIERYQNFFFFFCEINLWALNQLPIYSFGSLALWATDFSLILEIADSVSKSKPFV